MINKRKAIIDSLVSGLSQRVKIGGPIILTVFDSMAGLLGLGILGGEVGRED